MELKKDMKIRVRGLEQTIRDMDKEIYFLKDQMDEMVKKMEQDRDEAANGNEELAKTLRVEKHRVYELRQIIDKYREETRLQGLALKEYEIAYEALTGERHGKRRETEISLEDADS